MQALLSPSCPFVRPVIPFLSAHSSEAVWVPLWRTVIKTRAANWSLKFWLPCGSFAVIYTF